MKSSVALLLLVLGAASALPRPQFSQIRSQPVPTLTSRVLQADEAGQFTSSVVQSDGQSHVETGVLKATPDGKDYVLVKQGEYRYVSPEGVPVDITYTADEYGFHPSGAAIPVQGGPVAATF